MRINEKIINYRSRTWKASSQAKARLTSSSVSRFLRKNAQINISFLFPSIQLSLQANIQKRIPKKKISPLPLFPLTVFRRHCRILSSPPLFLHQQAWPAMPLCHTSHAAALMHKEGPPAAPHHFKKND